MLEMNQTAYAENLVAQYGISATSNIPGSLGVDLGPRKDGEPGGKGEFLLYRPLVSSLMWLSVMTRPDIAKMHCARALATAMTPVPGTGRRYCRSPRTRLLRKR